MPDQQRTIELATMTTLGLGGPAPSLVVAFTDQEIVDAVGQADRSGTPILVVGGGSNLVISDDGVDGPVLKIATTGVRADYEGEDLLITAAAGLNWDDVVAEFTDQGWSGIEFLSGIPGSTGATPVQNVGAYGTDMAQVLERVTVYERRTGQTEVLQAAELNLGYRTSVLRGTGRAVVLDLQMRLRRCHTPVKYAELARALGVQQGQSAPPALVREVVLGLRRGKGMVIDAFDPDTRSVGSFFTNPLLTDEQAEAVDARIRAVLGTEQSYPRFPSGEQIKLSAAWLIERAGFGRGFALGPGAAVSSKHTLALTNTGGSTADLVTLARHVRDGVQAAFGVTLLPEPVFVGVTLD